LASHDATRISSSRTNATHLPSGEIFASSTGEPSAERATKRRSPPWTPLPLNTSWTYAPYVCEMSNRIIDDRACEEEEEEVDDDGDARWSARWELDAHS